MIGVGNWAHVAKALRHRDHYLFNLTLVPSLTSLWAQRTGIGWLAWDLTHSPAWLGVIAAADLLPSVFLSPFAGVTADRSNPVRMMWLTQAIIMAYSCALWLMTASGAIDIWSLFGFALITGLNQPYSTAARMVFYPTLVPKEDLGTAIAINSTIFNLGRAVGPAVGGLLIGPFGVATLFFLNFACFLVHSVNLLRIKGRHAEHFERRRKGLWREIGDSMAYVARHPGIGPMLVLLTVSSILSRPVAEMLPGFADDVFSRGSEGLGWLLGAMGAGGLTGAVWLTRRGTGPGLTRVIVTQTLVMGATTLAFALSGSYWLGLAMIFAVGFAQTVAGTATQSSFQMAVEPAVRGRVMSIYSMVWRGTPAIGAIVVGWVAEITGLSWAVAGAGAGCMVAWLWSRTLLARMAPALEQGPPAAGKP
jgi:predicted MFS family arabinose efflux permease